LKSREAPEWLRYSEIYTVLLTPSAKEDGELARHLTYVATFGRVMYPLLLDVYGQFRRAAITQGELLEILGLLQSLFIRKMVVGESRDGIIARLCKTWGKSRDVARLQRDIVRRTPSDERVRSALQYRYLPHAGYVLGRLEGRDALDELEIEHISRPLQPRRGVDARKTSRGESAARRRRPACASLPTHSATSRC
jgi:hypothetical protein